MRPAGPERRRMLSSRAEYSHTYTISGYLVLLCHFDLQGCLFSHDFSVHINRVTSLNGHVGTLGAQ